MKRNLVILLTVLVVGAIASCKPGQKNNSDMGKSERNNVENRNDSWGY